ncbi:hypothetical protein [Allomuricauda sp. d1]|uniref:DoxX family protein n=1 Tax=Allomuricauda sp. d1 TaxID=3136725 RepID=UPI0031CDFDA9
MKTLIVLLGVSVMALIVIKIINGTYDLAFAARIGMSAMLIFAAMGHFMFPDGMAMMIPEFIPLKKEMVYFTAVLEIAAAVGLQIGQIRVLTGWLLIIFFILILPSNIKAAMEHLDFQKATFDGKGPIYLWFRIPLQIFFIVWVYVSSIKFD